MLIVLKWTVPWFAVTIRCLPKRERPTRASDPSQPILPYHPEALVLLLPTHPKDEEIMTHRRKPRVQNFIIHPEKKGVVKVLENKLFQLIARFTIDVTFLARWRSVGLRFQRRTAADKDAAGLEGLADIRQI